MATIRRNVVRLYNPTELHVRVQLVLNDRPLRDVDVPPRQEVYVPDAWLRRGGPLHWFDRGMTAVAVGAWAVAFLAATKAHVLGGDWIAAGLGLSSAAYLWSLMRDAWRATR